MICIEVGPKNKLAFIAETICVGTWLFSFRRVKGQTNSKGLEKLLTIEIKPYSVESSNTSLLRLSRWSQAMFTLSMSLALSLIHSEQRINCAEVIKRFIIQSKKATYLADRGLFITDNLESKKLLRHRSIC